MHPSHTLPTPLHLWRTLAGYIEAAFSLFGAPAELAQKLWLSRAEHKICAGWIAALETLLRRLLYLDALELAPTPAPVAAETKARPRRAMPANCGATFDMDQPESWRARFVLLRGPASAHTSARAEPRAQLINAVPSAPLALRLEALIRAYNTREQEAQRLANLLHARRAEAPVLAAQLTRPPPPLRIAQPPYADIADAGELCAAATGAKRAADTS